MNEINENGCNETKIESFETEKLLYGQETSEETLLELESESSKTDGFNDENETLPADYDFEEAESVEFSQFPGDEALVGFGELNRFDEEKLNYAAYRNIETGPVEISSETVDCLENFSQNCWDSLSTDERADAIEKLAMALADDLGIKFRPYIRFYEAPVPDNYAEYALSSNKVSFNTFNLGNAEIAAGVIAYEMRRVFQLERANNPQCARDSIFRENFENYTDRSENFSAYKIQPVEKDARSYAAGVVAYIK